LQARNFSKDIMMNFVSASPCRILVLHPQSLSVLHCSSVLPSRSASAPRSYLQRAQHADGGLLSPRASRSRRMSLLDLELTRRSR
jgi:hypothetical protein